MKIYQFVYANMLNNDQNKIMAIHIYVFSYVISYMYQQPTKLHRLEIAKTSLFLDHEDRFDQGVHLMHVSTGPHDPHTNSADQN